MQTQTINNNLNTYSPEAPGTNGISYLLKTLVNEHSNVPGLDEIMTRLTAPVHKKSFLVFKHNKYITIPVEKIAFFYVKYESSTIRCFDQQEYTVSHSLEQIQSLLNDKQFYRLNRQYLINFNAVKEAEHFYSRKLIVNLVVPVSETLLVSKEKVSGFLYWLDNR